MTGNGMIVVNDANVVIDVFKLGIDDRFFSMNHELHMPSEVYDEVKDCCKGLDSYISSGTLFVDPIQDYQSVVAIKTEKRQLSIADCSAIVLALNLNAILLTSDNNLRKTARNKNVKIGGHLWIFKELVNENLLTPEDAVVLLKRLEQVNPALGLPKTEVDNFISQMESIH